MSGIYAILDVIVGLAFIYLLLSLISSAGIEYLEMWLRKRGRFLYLGISELVAYTGNGVIDSAKTQTVVDKLYQNPLIFRLYQGEPNRGRSCRGSNLPSYISAATFVAALIDELAKNPANPRPGSPPNPPKTVAELISVIDETQLLSDEVKSALRTVLAPLEDYNAALKALEAWYNGTTERVSGWYRRHTQLFSFLFSLLIVAGCNVDTLFIAQSLMVNPSLRDAVVAAASEHVRKSAEAAAEQPEPEPGLAPAPVAAGQEQELGARIVSLRDTLFSVGLPIGWHQVEGPWWNHLPGWLISAIAISFGAPFWFETLNRIMQFRSTFKPKVPDAAQ